MATTKPMAYQIKKGAFLLDDIELPSFGSVQDLLSADVVALGTVHIKSFYPGERKGGGVFSYASGVAKSKHDGGMYVSPTVPYTDLNSFVSATGETSPAGTGVWVRHDVTESVRGEWYGFKTGIDVTIPFRKMAATAGVEALGIDIPAGTFNLTGNVDIYADNSATGKVSFLRGTGSRNTKFRTIVTGGYTGNSITCYGSIGKPNATHDMFIVTGFWMETDGTTANTFLYKSLCLYMQDFLQFYIHDVHTKLAERGLLLQNSLYGTIDTCRFANHREALLARKNGLTTGANAVFLSRCDFSGSTQYCVHATESHQFVIESCTFEGNGGKFDPVTGSLIAGVACIQFDRIGPAGGVGSVIRDCYFEGNAIRDINVIANLNYTQLVSVQNNIFNKTRSDMTAGRVKMIGTVALGTGIKATLEMRGNRFYSATNNADALYPDVEMSGFQGSGYGHAELLNYDNVFTAATPISLETYVVHKKAPDDGVICRGLAAGGITASASRNILSCTKTATGTYRIITNQLTSSMAYQIMLDNAGFAGISTAENNEALTVTTFDSAGAAADRSFRLMGKLI